MADRRHHINDHSLTGFIMAAAYPGMTRQQAHTWDHLDATTEDGVWFDGGKAAFGHTHEGGR